MIHPSRNQLQTTAQQLAAAESRRLLESEPRPAFDLLGHRVICTNPDAMEGQKNYTAIFHMFNDTPEQQFDGRNWINFPA